LSNIRTVICILLFAASPGALYGQEAEPAPEPEIPDRWKFAAELSYTDQTGNRVLRLLTGGLKFAHRESEPFELKGSVETRYGMSEDEVVSRNHFGSLSLDLDASESWSPFLNVTGERDPFKRLDLRLSGGAGAKYNAYPGGDGNNEAALSLALLYTYENLRPSDTDPTDPSRFLARWSMRFEGEREITPGATLEHSTSYQPVWDHMADYLLRSETGARVLITERLALSVSYQLNRTARPPEGVKPDDRLLKTGLIIDF
jgi:hypothetical protein